MQVTSRAVRPTSHPVSAGLCSGGHRV